VQHVPKAVYRSDVYDRHATALGGIHTTVRHVTARPLRPASMGFISAQFYANKNSNDN